MASHRCLNPQAALAEINEFRAKNGLKPLVLDRRLSRAAAMQSEDQAGRRASAITARMDRSPRIVPRARAKIASENVASGQKSFRDAMSYWERSSGHRENLLRPNVNAAGVAMAQAESGRAYWTLVLGAE
jgi:uncharacterized protein YkwD